MSIVIFPALSIPKMSILSDNPPEEGEIVLKGQFLSYNRTKLLYPNYFFVDIIFFNSNIGKDIKLVQ